MDIEFQDLSYVVKGAGGKQILKSINGKFCSGNLTAVLGASGSGKSTLLNILAGYISTGVSGSIRINGVPRDIKLFRKLSAYIMQDDLLQPLLKVEELMMIAAKLKLGNDISLKAKTDIVNEILSVLSLEKCAQTLTDDLSGGQKKRLSVALEMVSNPPVLFLDEPTSGLDTVSSNLCLRMLKKLAEQGRTIVCTIHQPSPLALQNFNQVYFIQDGMCVYNGSISNIIPFMASLGYECPVTYSPADYIIETLNLYHGSGSTLTETIENGKINLKDLETENAQPSQATLLDKQTFDRKLSTDFPTSFWTQLSVILSRMFIQMKRNTLAFWILVIHHIMVALACGFIFFKVGNNASTLLFSYHFVLCVEIFFSYTYSMLPVLLFPMEVQLIKREYFNRWYCLKPYFVALTLRSLPSMLILGLAFCVITYFLTDQPLEPYRFVLFYSISMLSGIIAESIGLIIGSTCNITNGSVLGPALSAIFILVCGVGAGYGDKLDKIYKGILNLSYIRFGIGGISQAILASRGPIKCPEEEIYCYYQDPNRLLNDMGTLNIPLKFYLLAQVIFIVLLRISAFLALKFRLTSEFSHTIVNYVSKLSKRR